MKTSIGIACLLLALTTAPIAAAPHESVESQAIVRALGDCGDPCVISGSNGGRVEMLDWDGKVVWQFDYATAAGQQHNNRIG